MGTVNLDKKQSGYTFGSNPSIFLFVHKQSYNGYEKCTHKSNKHQKFDIKGNFFVRHNGKLKNIIIPDSSVTSNISRFEVYFDPKKSSIPLIFGIIRESTRSSEKKSYYRVREIFKKNEDRFELGELSQITETLLDSKLESEKTKSTIIFKINDKVKYDKSGIMRSFQIPENWELINSDITPVEKANEDEESCIFSNGFKVYEHNFSNSVTSIQGGEKVQLRLIIPEPNSTKYKELKLFDSGMESTEKSIYYTKDSSITKLYIYFYGDQDPRPLMLCYGGSAYKPKSKATYSTQWVKDTKVTTCPCNNSVDSQLLSALGEVVGFLNEVDLHQQREYSVQRFNGNDIKVQIIHIDFKCYKIYTHTPQIKYRLGNIIYKENKNKLNYTLENQLESIGVYYYKHDSDREFPLIVELSFKEGGKIYHKLSSGPTNYIWEKLENNDFDREGDNLLDELFRLNQQFNGSHNPDKKECNPDKSSELPDSLNENSSGNGRENAAGITTGTLLGASAVGTGLAYYKYPELFTSMYSRLTGRGG